MFFSHHYKKGIKWYEGCFSGYKGEKCVGEIAPPYLSDREVPQRIKEDLKSVKLIVTLRNPIDQIQSLYNLWLSRGYVKDEIDTVILSEPDLLNNVLYYKHIKSYLRFFNDEQILVLFYEDFLDDPKRFLINIYDFLRIENIFPDDILDFVNRGRVPKSLKFEKVIVKAGDFLRRSGFIRLKGFLNKSGISDFAKALNTSKDGRNFMPDQTRSLIADYVREDIHNLSKQFNRDLSKWV